MNHRKKGDMVLPEKTSSERDYPLIEVDPRFSPTVIFCAINCHATHIPSNDLERH
jgi:hypothetical protein